MNHSSIAAQESALRVPPARAGSSFLVVLVLLAGASGCSRDAVVSDSTTGITTTPPEEGLAVTDERLSPHFSNAYRQDGFRFTGTPTPKGLGVAREEGVALVVNLLTDDETAKLPFDEAATVEGLGMEYVHLPLVERVPTKEAVDRFADLVAGHPGDVLVHCGSSNRVGALWAAYQGLHAGATETEAIARGRAAGMRSESLVRAVEALLRSP